MHIVDQTPKIGLTTAIAVTLNAIIGAGPFGAPTTLAEHNGIIALLTYAFVLVIVGMLAFSIARVAYLYPDPGSFYVYTLAWGGPYIAYVSVFLYLLSTIVAMSVLTHVASTYLFHIHATDIRIFGYATLLVSTMLNIFAVRISQYTQIVLLGTTIFLMVATITICAVNADFSLLEWPQDISWYTVLTPSTSVLFGFLGFEAATALNNRIISPKKNVVKAIAYATIIVSILYLAYVAGLVVSAPPDAFIKRPLLLTGLLNYITPRTRFLTYTIHMALLSAIIGTIHATMWSSAVLLRTVIKSWPQRGQLWENLSVCVMAGAMTLGYTLLYDITFGVKLTVTTRMIPYLCAVLALLTRASEWKTYTNYITIFGFIAGCVLLYFALPLLT